MGDIARSLPALAILVFVAGSTNFVIKVASLSWRRKDSAETFETTPVLKASSGSDTGHARATRRQEGLR